MEQGGGRDALAAGGGAVRRSPSRSGSGNALGGSAQMMQSAPDAERALSQHMASALDFTAIDQMDPSLGDGYRVLYDREVPVEIRTGNTSQDTSTLEPLRVKILMQGDDTAPRSLRIELTSENDLFFFYRHDLAEKGFRDLQNSQKLMVEFPDFPQVLIRMLNLCVKEPHAHLALLYIQKDLGVRLDFIQNMEYKFVELLSLPFQPAPEDSVRRQITYRYNATKARLALMQGRLADVNALVKIKNPSLLLQLHRPPTSNASSNSQQHHHMLQRLPSARRMS
eukprot:jgi/Chlat1/1540/Chrsp122S01829